LAAANGRIAGELRQAIGGLARSAAASRAIAGSPAARLFDARHPPIQGRDQFLELTRELTSAHRPGRTRLAAAYRREAFQISPQPPHRQDVVSSGFRAVVEIERD
jgi:hypothetical protein